jgi:hypothetical protein
MNRFGLLFLLSIVVVTSHAETELFTNVTTVSTVVKPIETRHAIEININGIGPAVDRMAYKKLRKTIGDAVTNEVIDKFVIYGYGKEGGFSGCIEGRPLLTVEPSKNFEKLVKQLTAIKPNRKTTAYSINRVKTCPALVAEVEKPTTIFVSKSDESKQCDAVGISLSAMQTQLIDITVYSAVKKSDGLMYIALCGAGTGNYNVYEIAAVDVEKATKIGFSEWIEKP